MTATLLPPAVLQFFDGNGDPLAGGRVYTFQPGTTNPKTTWQDAGQTIQNQNPITLDERGECIIWGVGAYREQLFQVTSDNVEVLIWDRVTTTVTADSIGALKVDGSNVAMNPTQALAFRTAIGANLSQNINFLQAGVGAVVRTAQDKMRETVTVQDFAAVVADGIINDGPAVKRAYAAAALFTPPAEVVWGATTAFYNITDDGPIVTLLDGQKTRGIGQPKVKFSGAGALFELTGKQRVEISDLDIEGNFVANAYAIHHATSIVGALANHYHNMRITNFGDGTTGAGIFIESDSANCELGPQLFMGNLTSNITITAPMDNLWLHHNVLSTPAGHPAGPTRAVTASNGGGATTMRISHNNITTEGLGIFKLSGGGWILDYNDIEVLQPFSNTNNAAIELLVGAFTLNTNTVSLHNVTGGNYCIFFADGVGDSVEQFGTYTGFNTKAVRVNTSPGNIYGPSVANTGPANLYSADNAGISMRETGSGIGLTQGYSVPPNTSFGRNGTIADGPTNFTNNETGANNAIVASMPGLLQVVGLEVTIPLNHTLQAGANTFNLNGNGADPIKSMKNPANNIATAYAATGVVKLFRGSGVWLDMSQ